MTATVVGFDIGNLTSYVSVARGGGIETVANEYSDRATPTIVAFGDKMRLIGTAAKMQHTCNIKNTVFDFISLVGKRFNDDVVTNARRYLPFTLKEHVNGRVGIQVTCDGQNAIFTPEQLVAMQLTKLRDVAESCLPTKVVDVALNVPSYFTDSERRAMLDATRIAGLNCMRLVNDTTAIGIAYGLYNKDLPSPEAPPRLVAFISVGHTSTQVAICSFTTQQMKVLATSADPHLGGRDFDYKLLEKFSQHFKDTTGNDVKSSAKATIRLLQECEKLKKVMSANASEVPINVECLMNDRDLCTKFKRADFEELSTDLLTRFENTLTKCLTLAKIQPSDVQFVELAGGSIRIPALKNIVARTFGQEGRTTLNLDEAVARGCALQAAICSPAFKVREFGVTEACPYAITLHWDHEDSGDQGVADNCDAEGTVSIYGMDTSIELFPQLYPIPGSRQLSLNRRSPFVLEARYSVPHELPNQNYTIGSFKVMNVVPANNDECCKIRIKARVNSHGIFNLSQAQLAEKYEKEVEVEVESDPTSQNSKETPSNKSMDVDAPSNGDVQPSTPASAETPGPDGQTPNDATQSVPKTEKKKKLVTRYKDLPVESALMQFDDRQLSDFIELEARLAQQDRLESERSHAKNSVEEYVYEMREKLNGQLAQFVTEVERETFSEQLSLTEDWLYGDGECLNRQSYVDRLNQLRTNGDRFCTRANEVVARKQASDSFGLAVLRIRKVIDTVEAGDEMYSHLTNEQLNTLRNSLAEHESWVYQHIDHQNSKPLTEDPILKSEQIIARLQALESVCLPIINTPKPAPPQPPTENMEGNAVADSNANNVDTNSGGNKHSKTKGGVESVGNSNVNYKKTEDMDLD